MARKNKTVLGVLGVILLIAGIIGTIPLAIKNQLYGISITGILVIIGIILIAQAFSD